MGFLIDAVAHGIRSDVIGWHAALKYLAEIIVRTDAAG